MKLSRALRFLSRTLPARLKALALANAPSTRPLFGYAPRSATLNITDRCFFKCVMCDQWRTTKTGELSTDEWRAVIAQLPPLGIDHASFAGGEVFMRRDLFDLLDSVRAHGMTSSVITNGFLLDRDKLERALASGLRTIGVSLDALGPAFDEIRGVQAASDRVVASLRLLADYKRAGALEVHVYFTLMRQTLGSYRDVLALSRDLGFQFIVNLVDTTPYFFRETAGRRDEFWIDADDPALADFQRFLVAARSTSPGLVHASPGEIAYFRDYFRDPVQKEMPCLVSQERLGIDSLGAVHGGCWSMGSYGNVRVRSLAEIIASPEYRAAHVRMFRKDCPGCSCGYSGNVRPHRRYAFRRAL